MSPQKRRPTIGVIADVHVHNFRAFGGLLRDGGNDRCRLTVDTLRRAVEVADEQKVEALFIAGDLFHVRRPEPAVIAAVVNALATATPVVIIPGNHDMLEATADGGNTACAPLHRQATVVREPEWFELPGFQVFCVPFQSRLPMEAYLEELLPARAVDAVPVGLKRVLVMHAGVYDHTSPSWMVGAKDAVLASKLRDLAEAHGFSAVFAGHYHQHHLWRGVEWGAVDICQVGTLNPTGFGDAGAFPDVGGMALYDGKEITLGEVEGPRFVIAHPGEKLPVTKAEMTFVRAVNVGGRAVELPGDIPLANIETVEERAAEEKDRALPTAADAGEALREYVERMPLPEGVDRAKVHEAVKAIWTEASQ